MAAAPTPPYHEAQAHDGGGAALTVRVAQLEERLAGLDRLYLTKFAVLEARMNELHTQARSQQKWVQGTAIMVALEVLAVAVALLARWWP